MGNTELTFILLLFAFDFSPSFQQVRRPADPREIYDSSRYRPEDYRTGPPRPFNFSYNVVDRNEGYTNYHTAHADSSGTVRGTYGYTLANGLFRVVEYVANKSGYYPTVYTNEPGVGKENPADVVMVVEPVPPGVHIPQGAQN